MIPDIFDYNTEIIKKDVNEKAKLDEATFRGILSVHALYRHIILQLDEEETESVINVFSNASHYFFSKDPTYSTLWQHQMKNGEQIDKFVKNIKEQLKKEEKEDE